MEKIMWLPLAGHLVARDNGGAGDPAQPVEMLHVMEDWCVDSPEAIDGEIPAGIYWLDVDWDAKQVRARVRGEARFFSWLATKYGTLLSENGLRRSRDQCRTLLGGCNMTELKDSSPERVELLRRKRGDDTIGLSEEEELLDLEESRPGEVLS